MARSNLHVFRARNVVTAAQPSAIKNRNELVNAPNSQETSQKHECADDFFRPRQRVIFLNAFDFGTAIVGFPKPKYSASFGQTLMQSMHFMQPGSTTIPYCFTSAWTRTFEVQVAVQCPH